MARQFAQVIVNLHHQKVDQIYTYRVPEGLQSILEEGMMAEVPFGPRNHMIEGFVIGLSSECSVPEEKLKSIRRILRQEPVFTKNNLALAQRMKEDLGAPLSSCLELFVPRLLMQEEKLVDMVQVLPDARKMDAARSGQRQQGFLNALAAMPGGKGKLKEIRKASPITGASLDSLQEQGRIRIWKEPEGDPPATLLYEEGELEQPKELNEEQQKAVDAIAASIQKGQKETFLLHGVTGSGKTEVYMQAIDHAIRADKQAILLVPEISLTPQLVQVFRRRFGRRAGVTHSRMTDQERAWQWKLAKENRIQVMIGPRSALFTPFSNLGLIVLDEEHETTYKSEQTPRYHARDIAGAMAEQSGCPLVLGSATPAVETYYRAQQGEYTLLQLSKRAVEKASMPKITTVDMRQEMAEGNMSIFCRRLQKGIEDRLAKGEQVILFLNRKGHSTFVNCRSCGFVLKCPRCYLPYTWHKDTRRLICHHCGKEAEMVTSCPQCGSAYIKYFGAGTQRVEEEVQRLFPQARILRMDMNTTSRKGAYETAYHTFQNRDADILVGTQMIAKGLDFPYVTLVGVVAADMTLYSSDYHSTERTFQLLTQVAGRAGRADLEGEVLLQTYSPDHYCIEDVVKQDYGAFYANEITARKLLNCPPFTHILQFLLTSLNEEQLIQCSKDFYQLLERYGKKRGFQLLGPSPASTARINNVFRWKILVKYPDAARLTAYGHYCQEQYQKKNAKIGIQMDLDPVTMF